MPIASVVMSAYQTKEEYLRECIESILNQTFKDFEFIIVCDPPIGNIKDIILSYKDERIVYVENEERIGVSKSANLGIEKAKGKYIVRMDADDIALPQRLKKQIAYLEANQDIGVCGSWAQYFNTEGTIGFWKTQPDNLEIKTFLLLGPTLMQPTIVIRKSVLDENNLRYSTVFDVTEDFDLWTRLSKYTKFHNIQEVLLLYRRHETNATVVRAKKGKEVFLKIVQENLQEQFDISIKDSLIDILWFEKSEIRNFTTSELQEITGIFNELSRKVADSGKYNDKLFNQIIFDKIDYFVSNVEISTKNVIKAL